MNVSCDFVDPSSTNIEDYKVIIVPALYAAPDSLLKRLNRFVKNGGHIVCTFKSGFSNEDVKVRTTPQHGIINEACGVSYSQFTLPQNMALKDEPFKVGAAENTVSIWMDLMTPTTAKVLALYDHPVWGKYAAITQNNYGKGVATYIGCITSNAVTKKLLLDVLQKTELMGADQQLSFPLITKSGINQQGKNIHYYFNYSADKKTLVYPHNKGMELLSGKSVAKNGALELAPWGVIIVAEN
ncbi:hypothetical protein BH10BAC3_BH10BAC3_28170 [soil metagenome]